MFDFAGTKRQQALIDALEIRLLKLETQHKLLVEEWTGVYDKYRVAMQKLARRDERAKTDDVAPGSTNGQRHASEVERWRVR